MQNEVSECKTQSPTNNNDSEKFTTYEYLKTNPSVLLGAISAIVATLTLYIKANTVLLVHKQLTFWEFSSMYSSSDNESLIYTATLSLIIFFICSINYLLVASISDVYVHYKRLTLTMKYFYQNNDSMSNEICEESKVLLSKIKKYTFMKLFSNIFFVIILSIFNSMLYAMSINSYKVNSHFLVVVLATIVQILLLFVFTIFIISPKIKRKSLKANSSNPDFLLDIVETYGNKDFPFHTLFQKGLRPIMSNTNIVLIFVVIILSCMSFTGGILCSTTNPIENAKEFPTTVIDDITYAIVYQNGNQYFLEEIEVDINPTDNSQTLIIYTNKQRVLTTNDLIINVNDYDKIIKDHK